MADGFRIKIDLSDFLNEVGMLRLMYISRRSMFTVSDLTEKIRKEYPECGDQDEILLFLEDTMFLIPQWESIDILNKDDRVKVILMKKGAASQLNQNESLSGSKRHLHDSDYSTEEPSVKKQRLCRTGIDVSDHFTTSVMDRKRLVEASFASPGASNNLFMRSTPMQGKSPSIQPTSTKEVVSDSPTTHVAHSGNRSPYLQNINPKNKTSESADASTKVAKSSCNSKDSFVAPPTAPSLRKYSQKSTAETKGNANSCSSSSDDDDENSSGDDSGVNGKKKKVTEVKKSSSSDSSSSSDEDEAMEVRSTTGQTGSNNQKMNVVKKTSSNVNTKDNPSDSSSSDSDDSSSSSDEEEKKNTLKQHSSRIKQNSLNKKAVKMASNEAKQSSSDSSSSSDDDDVVDESPATGQTRSINQKTNVVKTPSNVNSKNNHPRDSSSSDSDDSSSSDEDLKVKTLKESSKKPQSVSGASTKTKALQGSTQPQNDPDNEGKRKRKRKRKNKNKNKLSPEEMEICAGEYSIQSQSFIKPSHVTKNQQLQHQPAVNSKIVFNEDCNEAQPVTQVTEMEEFSAEDIRLLYSQSVAAKSMPAKTNPENKSQTGSKQNGTTNVGQNVPNGQPSLGEQRLNGNSAKKAKASQPRIVFTPRALTLNELRGGNLTNGTTPTTKSVVEEETTNQVNTSSFNARSRNHDSVSQSSPAASSKKPKQVNTYGSKEDQIREYPPIDTSKDVYTNRSKIIVLPKNYESYNPVKLEEVRTNDVIAFKMIEMSENYTPEMSDFKEGLIQHIEGDLLRFKIINSEAKKRCGRFELEIPEEDDFQTGQDIMELSWRNLIDPRLVVS